MKLKFHIATVRGTRERVVTVYQDGLVLPLRGGRFPGLEEARAHVKFLKETLQGGKA